MKNLLFTSILTLACYFCAFAQNNNVLPCPTITVTGPSSIPAPNEPFIFTVSVGKEAENYNVKYIWTVSNGEIIEGQGNFTVKVLQDNVTNGLTVRVQVEGLPKHCLSESSETLNIDPAPQAALIGEFLTITAQNEKSKLFKKITALDNDPYAQLYIIFKFKKNTSQKEVLRNERKLIDSLIKSGIEKERITLVKSSAPDDSIQFWLVPPGASNPEIDN